MKTRFVEVVGLDRGRPANWGKFLVARFDEEDYAYESKVGPPKSLLRQRGWSENHAPRSPSITMQALLPGPPNICVIRGKVPRSGL